jgi:hypothetical protein
MAGWATAGTAAKPAIAAAAASGIENEALSFILVPLIGFIRSMDGERSGGRRDARVTDIYARSIAGVNSSHVGHLSYVPSSS